MESIVSSAPAGYFCYSHDPNAVSAGQYMSQQMPYAMVPTLPSTPIYSRPGSSCSQQPAQVLRSLTSVPSNMSSLTPLSSPPTPMPALVHGLVNKPAILLETELRDMDASRYPSTPPLSSTSSSTMGSPGSSGSCDMLATPLNPMFSGLESFRVKEPCVEMPDNLSLAGWASCTSPPLTPVFINAQQHCLPVKTEAAPNHELLSASACPSLSPSPSPYPRSIASEQDNDFCDPRNLTVSLVEDDVQPETSVLALCDIEEDYKTAAADIHSVNLSGADFDQSIHGLPSLDDFPEIDSEDDFVNGLVNLGSVELSGLPSVPLDMTSRSRSSSSLSSSSEFNCDQFFDTWESSSLPTDLPASKRQRTVSDAALSVNMVMAAGEPSGSQGQSSAAPTSGADHPSDSENGTQSAGSASPENTSGEGKSGAPTSTNRRGRKQSLTEDPSKIFACDLCNRRFRRQEHLKRHYRSLHTQEKPFSCHECGKKFSRSDNLAQHARTHGAGAFVMNLYDDPDIVAAATGSYPGHPMFAQHAVSMGDDYSNMGQVLFQVAAEIPGSASEGSDDGSDGKKKRKRTE